MIYLRLLLDNLRVGAGWRIETSVPLGRQEGLEVDSVTNV